MRVKWKIFFAFNLILALPALIGAIFLIVELFSSRYNSNDDYLLYFLFIFGFVTIPVNSFLNIYLLQRFYPDKLIPGGTRSLAMLFLILTILVTIGLLVLLIYGASEEFSRDNEYRDSSGKFALAVIFLAVGLLIMVLVMQIQLPRLITRNNRNSMHQLIESIGN